MLQNVMQLARCNHARQWPELFLHYKPNSVVRLTEIQTSTSRGKESFLLLLYVRVQGDRLFGPLLTGPCEAFLKLLGMC